MSDKIKILTYNIFMRPYGIKTNKSDHKEERLSEIIEKIKDHEIVCFQEAFDTFTHRHNKLIEESRKVGFKYFTNGSPPGLLSPFLIDSGLLILSKVPIVYSEFHYFKPGSYEDALAQKGILYAKIDIGESNFVHIFTLHTQANIHSIEKIREIPNNISRINQIIESRDFIDSIFLKHFRNHDLAYLMGDFNVNANCNLYPLKNILEFFENNPFREECIKGKNEYDLLIKIFKSSEIYEIEDLFFKGDNDKFPVTYGDCFTCEKGLLNAKEQILTHLIDQTSQQCLDFIFELKRKYEVSLETDLITLDESQETLKNCGLEIKYEVSEATVNSFEIQGKIFTQLSDHHGVEFEIKKK